MSSEILCLIVLWAWIAILGCITKCVKVLEEL